MNKWRFTNWVGYMCVKLYKPFSRGPLNKFLNRQVHRIISIPSKRKTLRVLNIGSGGDVYDLLKDNPRFSIEQLDINPERKPDIVADASNMHMIADGTYDYIFAMEVLEHIPTPQAAVDEISRVLKPSGELIFSTPFMFPIHDAPHDYYRYTKYGLDYLLRAFNQREIKPRNNYLQSVMLMLLRTIVIGNKKQRLAAAFVYISTILTYPVWLLVASVFDSDLATSGYFGVVQKNEA